MTGNYWSDYTGVDSDGDTIGDDPYNITTGHKDYKPLMAPWLPGEVYHDGKVDIRDIAIVALYYGSLLTPESPEWAKRADLDEDSDVDYDDINIPKANFGQIWQIYWGES